MKNAIQRALRKFEYSILKSTTADTLDADVAGLNRTVSDLQEKSGRKEREIGDPPMLNSHGIWIYISEGDERGKQLLAAGGFLNPTTMRAWRSCSPRDGGRTSSTSEQTTGRCSAARLCLTKPGYVGLSTEDGEEIEARYQRGRVCGIGLHGHGDALYRFRLVRHDEISRESESLPSGMGVGVRATTLDTVLSSFKTPSSEVALLLKTDVERT